MTQVILAAHSYSTRAIETIIEVYRTFKQERVAKRLAKQTIKELSKLTDKELNDIGLSRGDIWYVAHNQNDNLRGWV
jgi:uncharacterized protein YjiS (DUF1127 family)